LPARLKRQITVAQWSRSWLSAFVGRQTGEKQMLRKLVTVVLIGGSLATAACNTVRGAAKDVNSAANAVDNAT
jgi:predicted small secreted protein